MPQYGLPFGDEAPETRLMPVQYRVETETPSASAPNPHAPPPPWLLTLIGLGVVLMAGALVYRLRSAAVRAWRLYAKEIQAEFSERNHFAPAYVSGKIEERPFFLATAVSHEDEAPYYHTCGSMPINNPGMVILGLRRKSMLEEAQTRKERAFYDFGDTDFDRRFHLIANDPTVLPTILTAEVRRGLGRYSDVEIYIRLDKLEWRRAGAVNDLGALRHLNGMLLELAKTVDALPKRTLSLSQRLVDEGLIEKGV